jgi:hypothetical protein
MSALRAIGAGIWYVKGAITLGSEAEDGWTHEVVRQKLKAPDFCEQSSLLEAPGDSSAEQFAQEKENVKLVRLSWDFFLRRSLTYSGNCSALKTAAAR